MLKLEQTVQLLALLRHPLQAEVLHGEQIWLKPPRVRKYPALQAVQLDPVHVVQPVGQLAGQYPIPFGVTLEFAQLVQLFAFPKHPLHAVKLQRKQSTTAPVVRK